MKKLDIKANKIMTIIFSIIVVIFIGLLGTWAYFKQTKTPKELTPLTICTVIGLVLTLVFGLITWILKQITIHEYFSKTYTNKDDIKNEE